MYLLELAGEDDAFAIAEAERVASGVRSIGPGVATATSLAAERVRGLAFTRRSSEFVGRSNADVESARTLLEAAAIDRSGTVAVRATDVRGSTGVDTLEAERVLGRVLVDRGFAVDLEDPDHVLRAVFAAGPTAESTPLNDREFDPADCADVCALGWQLVESVRDFGVRAPTEKPFFQPGSMDPLLARAVANLAGARPGATLVDPMCGTGGILVEAGLVGADVVGVDAQSKMVGGTRKNLNHYLGGTVDAAGTAVGADVVEKPLPVGVPGGSWWVVRGDATRLPFRDGCADGVVFDAPYGRQSKIETHRLEDLVAGALTEARRLAPRAVVIGDRSWAGPAREAGWAIKESFEHRVHRSLTRYVLVLADGDTEMAVEGARTLDSD